MSGQFHLLGNLSVGFLLYITIQLSKIRRMEILHRVFSLVSLCEIHTDKPRSSSYTPMLLPDEYVNMNMSHPNLCDFNLVREEVGHGGVKTGVEEEGRERARGLL